MNYKITLWLDDKPISYHSFSLNFEDKGFYRAAVSLEYFQKRESEKLYNCHVRQIPFKGKRCHVQREEDIHFIRSLPEYKYEDVWEFYKGIGYDYKRKVYL